MDNSSTQKQNAALLIVDMFNHFDFPEGPSLAKQALAVVDNIASLRKRFEAHQRPVIYVNDNWTDWQGEFKDLVSACRASGGASGQLAEILLPGSGNFYVLKPAQSAFFASALPVLLDQLRVDALVVTGISTEACVLTTATDARMRGYPVWVPEDCSAAPSASRHRAALALMKSSALIGGQKAMPRRDLFPPTILSDMKQASR